MRRFTLQSGISPASLGIAVTVALLWLGVCSTASAVTQAGKDTGTSETALEIVGGKDEYTVELQVRDDLLAGAVTIVVRSDKAPTPTFVPDEDPGPAFTTKSTPSDGIHAVRLELELPAGEPASAADGSLVLVVDGKTKLVRINGAIRKFDALAVQPSKVELDSVDDVAAVTLSGADLVEFLRSGGFGTPTTRLGDGNGHTIKAHLNLPVPGPVAESNNPNRVRALIELEEGEPGPGKYSGTLALSNLATDAPEITIELSSGRGLFCMLILVVIGALLGGLFTRLVAFAGRRRMLLKALDQSAKAFKTVCDSDAAASWWPGDLLGGSVTCLEGKEPTPLGEVTKPKGWRRVWNWLLLRLGTAWAALTNRHSTNAQEFRLHGLQGLIISIERARSSKDLDEDTDRALNMVARIQRWLRIEPAARRLAVVAEKSSPDRSLRDDKGRAVDWSGSNTWRDTQLLLEIAKREPADVKAADDLVWRLIRQAEWHHVLAEAWSKAAEDSNALLAAGVLALDAELGKAAAVGKRTPEEQDLLDIKLELLEAKAGEIDAIPDLEKLPKEENGITLIDWKASPNLFTGWATLDGQSYGQLAHRAARGARKLEMKDVLREVRARFGLADLFWTLFAVVLAGLAYGLTAYSDTWGSGKDMLDAFIAGALGTVVIDWAALPIFESIRLRASQADAGKAGEGDKKKSEGEKKEDPEGGGDDKAGSGDGKATQPKEEKAGRSEAGLLAELDGLFQGIQRTLARAGFR